MDHLLILVGALMNIGYVNSLHMIAGVLVFALTHFIDVHLAMVLVILVAFGKELCQVCRGGSRSPDIVRAAFMIAGGFIGFVCNMGK